MDDKTSVDFDPFRGGEISRKAPSTEPQREILAAALLDEVANTAYNEAISMRVTGPLEPAAVESALRRIIDRHDALRMTFTPAGTEVCVTDDNDFQLEVRDLCDQSASAQEESIQALWLELANTPMNLIDGPLLRAVWLKLGEDSAELLMSVHHVVCDGWSYYVILDELSRILCGETAGFSEPAPSFADFAELQHASTASNKDIDYWLDHFKTVPPALDLPLDRPRPATRTFAATRIDHEIDSDLTRAIRSAAGKYKASIVNVVLAGVTVLLHRLSKADDLAIGLPVARQSTDNLPDLVGHGVQLLPVRVGISPQENFGDVVGRVKSAVLDASDHPNFTFGSLVRELNLSGDPSRVPLVPVIFNIDQPSEDLKFGAATASVRTVPRTAEGFEIFFNVLPSNDVLVVETTFNTDLFDEESIESWLQALECILGDVAGDPDKTIGDIRLSPQTPSCYETLNDTLRSHEHDHWLSALAAQVEQSPESTAVIDEQGSISYSEFDALSGQLASELAGQGVGTGDLVGIYMNRSRHLLVAVAAVHKTGAAYVPLDPSFPESRLVYMLQDSGATIIVSDIDIPSAFAKIDLPVVEVPLTSARTDTFDAPRRSGDDLAYIIYTSGSTGNPKGVKVHHDAVANFLSSMAREPGIDADSRLLAVTTLSFDISVLELLLPLFSGASVYVASREQGADARVLASLISDQSISIMQATPATWKMLLADEWKGNQELKVLCGGEALPPDLARQLVGKVGELWNMYGPTETTIWSTCRQVDSGFSRITVGRPIDNTQIYIMDEAGLPLPPTVPGELCIGGRGVALGYHNLPELTAEKFIESQQFGRTYRTGDLARVLPNGDIEHLGRIDDQVKVRGFRIELGEIESVLQAHADVDQAAAYVWTAKENDQRIVACCVPAPGQNISAIKLRKHLRANLPEYMVPQYFMPVDGIPLTPNAKVDRRNLPSPIVSESQLDRQKADPPETPAEVIIADIWTKLIQPARAVRRHDMFFEIGGHSLLALDALRQTENKFDVRLDPRALFAHDLAAIAEQCAEADSGASDATALRPTRLAEGSRKLLSEDQERILRECLQNPDTLRWHITFTFRILGALDVDCYEQSLKQVFSRHSILCASFGKDDEGYHQKINPVERACVLQKHELGDVEDIDAAAMELMVSLSKQPMDVETGPLAVMHLIRIDDDHHIFFFLPHHLVFDGWSFDIFLRELGQFYESGVAGKSLTLEELPIQYSDFSTWQRERSASGAGEATDRYWSEELQSPPPPIVWPGLTSSTARPLERATTFVEKGTRDSLELACEHYKAKLPDFLLAALLLTLSKAVNRSDHLIGLATAGRFLPEVSGLIGLFYGYLPARFRLSDDADIGHLMKYVGERVQESSEYQDISHDRLSRLGGIPLDQPLYQVTYSYQEARSRDLSLGDLPLQQISVDRPDTMNDLDFWLRNTRDGLVVSLDYRGNIAEHATMERFLEDYLAALHGFVNNNLAGITWQCGGQLTAGTETGRADSGERKSGLLGRLLQGKR